jgi:hypothetical protein
MLPPLPLLHVGKAIAGYWFVPSPPESHHWFGAGFLFVGVLLVVECLAGSVWHKSKLRSAVWPGMAMFMGEGLVMVAFLDPQSRAIHLTVGLLVLTAGWLELRYRFGQITRFSADLFVVPALLSSGFEMGVIHGGGVPITAYGHRAMGLTAAVMAGTRLYQARAPSSFARSVMMGALVVLLGLILLIFQP